MDRQRYLSCHLQEDMWISTRKTVPIVSFLLLSTSILLSICIRTANLPQLERKYLLGTDAYHFLRQAELIVSEGHLPNIDTRRWQPEGRDLRTSLNLFSYVLAYSYHLVHRFFPSLSLYVVAVYAPIICYAFSLLVLYGLWRNVFDTPTALLAVNFTAICPTLNLHRSSAGFADRDAFVLLLWLIMFLFYLKSSESLRRTRQRVVCLPFKAYFYAILSGMTAGLLALTWEGVGLATVILVIWLGLRVLRGHFSQADWLIYNVWYLCFMTLSLTFTRAYHNIWLPYTFLALVLPTFFHIWLCLSLLKNGEYRCIMLRAFHSLFATAACTGGFITLVVLTVLKPPDLREFFQQLFDNFISPLGSSPLMQSITELAELSGMRFLTTYSVTGLAAMAGCGLLAYRFFAQERIVPASRANSYPKNHSTFFWFALLGFETLLCGTLFSLFIANTKFSFAIYSLSLCVGTLALVGAYHFCRSADTVNSANNKLLLLLVWGLILLFSSRGAERYLFFLDVLLHALSSFLIIQILRFVTASTSNEKAREHSTNLELCALCLLVASELYVATRLFSGINTPVWMLVGVALLSTVFGMFLLHQLAGMEASYFHRFAYLAVVLLLILLTSSDVFYKGFVRASTESLRETATPHPPQLQASFADIAVHTDDDATIAAWWDYGSLINYFTKRTTVVDSDHYMPARIRAMAQHVFSGTSPTEALTFLRAHNATHLLITTNELLRLDTITYTGTDDGYDRLASVHFLTPIRSKQVDASMEQTDFILHNSQTTDTLAVNSEIYPPGEWRLYGVSLTYDRTNNAWTAIVHGTAGNREFALPPSELQVGTTSITYDNACVPGTIVIFPNHAGENLQAFYVSARARLMLTVRLYLFLEDIPEFSLVYDTNATARCEPYGLRLFRISPYRQRL